MEPSASSRSWQESAISSLLGAHYMPCCPCISLTESPHTNLSLSPVPWHPLTFHFQHLTNATFGQLKVKERGDAVIGTTALGSTGSKVGEGGGGEGKGGGGGGALSTPALLQNCPRLCCRNVMDDHRPYLPPSSFPDSNRFPLDSSTGYFSSASIRVVYLDITSGRS